MSASPSSLCSISFFLHSALPLPFTPSISSHSLNPSLSPLQCVALMCYADPLYLTQGWEEDTGMTEGKEKWKERRTSHLSALSRPLLTSHSAVFRVNIFTAPLITRTSGTDRPTSPTPSQHKIKYSYGLWSSLFLLGSPLPGVFSPHIMPFLALSLPLMLFWSSRVSRLHTSTPIFLCLSTYHLPRSLQQRTDTCVMYVSHFAWG